MKRRYLYRRARYRGLIRNRCCALTALHDHERAKSGSGYRLTAIQSIVLQPSHPVGLSRQSPLVLKARQTEGSWLSN